MVAIGAVVEDEAFVSDHATDLTYSVQELLAMSGPEQQAIYDHLARHKVHVYVDAVTYYKVAGVENPLFKYVLFYNERDLDVEIHELELLVTSLESQNLAATTERLRELRQTRAEATMGSKYDPKKASLADIRTKLMGIHDINMVKPFQDASVLKDIQFKSILDGNIDRKKLQEYGVTAKENLNKLRDIKTQGTCYTVPGKDEVKYYWVPVEYLFN